MFKDIFNNRVFMGVLLFFMLTVVSSLLYSWHVRRTSEAEFQRSDRFWQGLQKKKQARKETPEIQSLEIETPDFVSTLEENKDAPMADEIETLPNKTENLDSTDAFLTETAEAEDVPVSAYGFGPYPQLPAGFPKNYWDSISKNQELLIRVELKLMDQGINARGGSMQENGLVYPTIPGTIYIEWDHNGTERYISRMMGDPHTVKRIRNFHNSDTHPHALVTEGNIPADVTVFIYPDGGIDPYKFLNLEKE